MKKLYLLAFIFSLHLALAAYVNSTFLSQYIGEHLVGLVYVASSVLTLIIFAYSSSLMKKLGNKKLVHVGIALNLISLIILGIVHIPVVLVTALVVFLVTNNLVMFGFDTIFESFESPDSIGRTRGMYLSVTNLAWMLSPLFSGYIIQSTGYQSIYIIGACLALATTIGLSVSNIKNSFTYKKVPLLKTFFRLENDEGIRDLVFISFILHLFYAIMVVYTPIYLIDHLGFDWSTIGIVFTVMLTPFVILGLPVGRLIDRGVKEKKLLRIGLTIAGGATLIIAGTTSTNIALWAILLLLTRIGASILETTTETFLFKKIKPEDIDALSVFRDMSPLAYLIAPIVATGILYILPFKSIFFILGCIMIGSTVVVNRLKD
jgi:MFS family permease